MRALRLTAGGEREVIVGAAAAAAAAAAAQLLLPPLLLPLPHSCCCGGSGGCHCADGGRIFQPACIACHPAASQPHAQPAPLRSVHGQPHPRCCLFRSWRTRASSTSLRRVA